MIGLTEMFLAPHAARRQQSDYLCGVGASRAIPSDSDNGRSKSRSLQDSQCSGASRDYNFLRFDDPPPYRLRAIGQIATRSFSGKLSIISRLSAISVVRFRGALRSILTSITFLLLASPSHAQPTQSRPSVDEVIQMVAARLPDETILLQLKKVNPPIEFTAQDLIKMKQIGASDQLLNELSRQGKNATSGVSTPSITDGSLDESILPGVPIAVHPTTNQRFQLERKPVNVAIKTKALGLGGGKSVIRFEGRRSQIRLPATPPPKFFIRFASLQGFDPYSNVGLDRLEIRKEHREATLVTVGPLGFGGKSNAGASTVAITMTPCSSSVLCFAPSSPLAPGEYVITVKPSSYGFLFGVD